MEELINALQEVYDLTLKQESAVNLGMVPRFMRLLEEKEKKLEIIDEIDVEKDLDKMYDEESKNVIMELLHKINQLNNSNIEKLKTQKKELKAELDKLAKAKEMVERNNNDVENLRGHYIDNKK